MPYIAPTHREKYEIVLSEMPAPQTAGELNYLFTRLAIMHLHTYPRTGYEALNNIAGALECAKLEMYRRLAAPYEDEKIKQNGDVYP